MASGTLNAADAEELKNEQLQAEEKLGRELAQRRALQVSLMKGKLAQRKKEKLKKLREAQQAEKARVGGMRAATNR